MQDETSPLLPHRQSCWSAYRLSSLFRTQPLEYATNNNKDGSSEASLKKCLTIVDLIAYGVASTLGAGIFVASGQASVVAGPSVILSFLLAGLASLLSALCYAEFAARIPVSGSAYSFSYVALGEIIGWTIGWCLTLEYSISASAVARGWAATVVQFLSDVGVNVPHWLDNWTLLSQSVFTLSPLSCVIILFCTLLLVFGAKESSTFNIIITIFNLSLITFIIILGGIYSKKENLVNFFPNGFRGVFTGAGIVFFAYIGFDAVTTLAAEVKNPKRDMPIGIVGTLLIATLMYMGVSLVLNGMVPYSSIDIKTPIAHAFSAIGLRWAAIVVALGTVTTLTATTLACLLGQPRIFYQMSSDGLLFKPFSQVTKKTQIPMFGTIFSGVFAMVLAFFFDINILTNVISLGTLLAFSMVCGGIVTLRYREPNENITFDLSIDNVMNRNARVQICEPLARCLSKRVGLLVVCFFLASALFGVVANHFEKWKWPWWCPFIAVTPLVIVFCSLLILRPRNVPSTFACPWVPFVPCLGIFVNFYLMMGLPLDALEYTAIWCGLGLLLYFAYGIRKSKLNYQLKQSPHVNQTT